MNGNFKLVYLIPQFVDILLTQVKLLIKISLLEVILHFQFIDVICGF